MKDWTCTCTARPRIHMGKESENSTELTHAELLKSPNIGVIVLVYLCSKTQ